jgi:hypothetical protein
MNLMSTLNKTKNTTVEEEYKTKLNIKKIDENNLSLVDEQSLKDMSRIAKYMNGVHEYIDRGIIYAHLDFEPITTAIANKQPFTIVSGKIHQVACI